MCKPSWEKEFSLNAKLHGLSGHSQKDKYSMQQRVVELHSFTWLKYSSNKQSAHGSETDGGRTSFEISAVLRNIINNWIKME